VPLGHLPPTLAHRGTQVRIAKQANDGSGDGCRIRGHQQAAPNRLHHLAQHREIEADDRLALQASL
jgi:hypothetical protein